MPNIFLYLNYRHFLRDIYLEKKAANPRYSYRVFNKAAGLSSPSFFKLVTEGKRNLSDKTIDAFVAALKLSKREAQFFRTLVYFNQAVLVEERNQYYRQLAYFKEYNAVKNLEAHQYQFYAHWYHAAIIEMTRLKQFREDPRWIAAHLFPPVTEEEVRESLKLLTELGLLKRGKNLRLEPAERNLSTSPEVRDLSVLNFHRQMILRAEQALLNTDGDFRDISSVTVALDQRGFHEAKRRIQEFRRELNVLLSGIKEPDHVYQIGFQIFNLTGIKWQKDPS